MVREVVVVSAVEILEAEAAVETLEDSVAAAVAVEPEGRPFFDTRTPPNKPSTALGSSPARHVHFRPGGGEGGVRVLTAGAAPSRGTAFVW